MSNKTIYCIIMLTALTACKTTDNEADKILYSKKASTQDAAVTSAFRPLFLGNITGTYTTPSGETLVIDGSGSFKIGNSEYYIQDVINENQAVYVSTTPDSSNRKVYTYHGIIADGSKLYSVAFRPPTQGRQLSDKDSEKAWEVNTFQPENINWSSGLNSVIGTKN